MGRHDHAPIPSPDGEIDEAEYPTLAQLGTRRPATLRRVPDEDADMLRSLARLSLIPGARIEVTGEAPFKGPLTVRIGDQTEVIGHNLASSIGVQLLWKTPRHSTDPVGRTQPVPPHPHRPGP